MSSYVYFVRAGSDGPVKIGHTIDVDARINQLQTGCPEKLELLGVIKCDSGREREAEFHRKFAKHRIPRSEWFRWSEGLAETIAAESVKHERGDKIDVVIAAIALGLPVITLPIDLLPRWKTEAKRNGRSAWTQLYLWLRKEHGAGAIDDREKQGCTLHNRTRVGEISMETLRGVEEIRLRAAFRARHGRLPRPMELREAMNWSDFGSGPITTDPETGRHLVGDGLFVLPDHNTW